MTDLTPQGILKWLTLSGTGSRRQMAEAIKAGRVAVNGQTVESFLHPVRAKGDSVTLDGKKISFQADTRTYLMLNKPRGIVSTTVGERGEQTVLDIIPERYKERRLYPVGRLDKDSTGLILLTNDGELTFRLTHPSFEHEKEYYITLEKILDKKDRVTLERGIELDGVRTAPARIRKIDLPPYNYSIIIHEGRKRQVRRMFINLGYRLLELKRVRMGHLTLGSLAEGQTRPLTRQEIHSLKKT